MTTALFYPINLTHARHNPISREEEAALVVQIRAGGPEGEQARTRLLNAHLRFVISAAKQFNGNGLPMDDLIQEGVLGLNRAADLFDPKACKFTSYAIWWIRQNIVKALHANGTIVTPGPSFLKAKQKVADSFRKRGKEDQADAVEASIKSTLALRSLQSCEALLEVGWEPADPDADPAARIEADDAARAVEVLLASLRPKERDLIRMSFGLDAGTPATLHEVGGRMGVSRERVRQIRARALEKMRMAAAPTESRPVTPNPERATP